MLLQSRKDPVVTKSADQYSRTGISSYTAHSDRKSAQMEITQFDLHAKLEDDHWWFKARRNIIFNQLSMYVPLHKGNVVVEIGCGTGGNLKLLHRYYQAIGVDISSEALSHASKRVGCRLLLGDFREALSDMWNDIEAVILADVLEHIDDDAVFLNDIFDNLKPGAIVLITVPAHSSLWSHHDVVLGHKRRYSKTRLRALWSNRKEVEELIFSPFNFFLFPSIVLYRLIRIARSASDGSDLFLPSARVNNLLYRAFALEHKLLKLFPLPWGVSYLAVLRKSL